MPLPSEGRGPPDFPPCLRLVLLVLAAVHARLWSLQTPRLCSCFMYQCCSCAAFTLILGIHARVLGCLTWVTEGAAQNELCPLFKPEGLGQGSLARVQQAVVLPPGWPWRWALLFRVQSGSHHWEDSGAVNRQLLLDLVLHGECINCVCVCMYSHVHTQVCVRVHGEGLGQRTTLGVSS